MYNKSFSAGPLRLQAQIWPSTGGFDNIAYTNHWSLEPTLLAIIFVYDIFHVPLTEQNTIKKKQVYENATMYENATRVQPPMSQLPIVWPSQARPFQALP